MDAKDIAQFISIIIELVADSQNSGKSNTTVSEMMSQAWKNTLDSLYMRVNPGLERKAITLLKQVYYWFKDRNNVYRTQSNQKKYVFEEYFSQLNIDEQIFSTLTEQCKELKDNNKSPFKSITDEELINLLNSNKMQEHIITFIKESLKNKTEFLSFLEKHNESFFNAFKSHFFALADLDYINAIMNRLQSQQLEQQSKQLEQQSKQLDQQSKQLDQQSKQLDQLNKTRKNLVDKRRLFSQISVRVRNDQGKAKDGKKKAFFYSQFGDFILMQGSYVTLTATPKCPSDIKQLREQYANLITEDGLLLKNIHFKSQPKLVNFIDYSSDNRDSKIKLAKNSKYFVINDAGEYVSYRKQLKK